MIAHLSQLETLLLVAASLMFALSLTGLALAQRRNRMAARLARARSLRIADGPSGHSLLATLGSNPVRRLGEWIAKGPLLGRAEMVLIQKKLMAAGFDRPGTAPYVVGLKFMLAVMLSLALWLWLGSGQDGSDAVLLLLLLGGALAGWRAPDLVLAHKARQRRTIIERGMPDALDLLVICGEAGLGLDTALTRVAEEIRPAYPALGKELTLTAAEMRVLPDRHTALVNMAERLEIEVLRSITATLTQTMRYGTPLGQALRVLANEMRRERMVQFEEKAARLPVMLTVPMVVFILPCVFIVVGGPAVLDLIAAFSKF
jgi:tight adherence protein C